MLAAWELIIGLGFISGRFTRIIVLLTLFHLTGTFIPVISSQELVFTHFPQGLTMEGEFIAKNLILITAAIALGATSRGGELSDQPLSRINNQ